MLKNAYLLAKIRADTAENEQHFAEMLPKTGNYPLEASRPEAAAARTATRPRRGPRAGRPGRRGALGRRS